jgi:predicted RNA-binding protein with PUA-like domain
MAYWILKTEPETYSFDQLKTEGKTTWNGVRNYQARNFLRETKIGDGVLIYHSGKERSIVGLGKVIQEAYPEADSTRAGDWVQIDIAYDPELSRKLKKPIALESLKKDKILSQLPLVKQSRLSVSPVNEQQWKKILSL